MQYNFDKLKQNMLGMISEQQLKLGYMKETVRLYYLEKPLCRILGIRELVAKYPDTEISDSHSIGDRCEEHDTAAILHEFAKQMESEIGHMEIIPEEGRYCFVFSPEVSEYVHEHMHEQFFLKDLIEAVMGHGTSNHEIEADSVPDCSQSFGHNHVSDFINLNTCNLEESVISHKKGHDMPPQISTIINIFQKYSTRVHVEDMRGRDMDFDYLVYFEDGIPDDMYYCLTDEGCHVTYHRYLKEDYAEIFETVIAE